MMGGACVAAGSGLGSFTVDSSSYAEVYALHKASKDIEYIQMIVNVIMEGNLPPKGIVFKDNTTNCSDDQQQERYTQPTL
jgi:hypothetical protein